MHISTWADLIVLRNYMLMTQQERQMEAGGYWHVGGLRSVPLDIDKRAQWHTSYIYSPDEDDPDALQASAGLSCRAVRRFAVCCLNIEVFVVRASRVIAIVVSDDTAAAEQVYILYACCLHIIRGFSGSGF